MSHLRLVCLLLLPILLVIPLTAQTGRTVIVQTNSAGDSVHLIDPVSDTIVAEIPDAEVIHGAAAAPDGTRLYLSNESTATLDIVDAKTLRITKKIPLTGQPNNVAIRNQPRGSVATVIDTQTELPRWSIHFEGGVRPICFETNPDGSTKRMFVQVTNLHGFAVVEWDKRKEVEFRVGD